MSAAGARHSRLSSSTIASTRMGLHDHFEGSALPDAVEQRILLTAMTAATDLSINLDETLKLAKQAVEACWTKRDAA